MAARRRRRREPRRLLVRLERANEDVPAPGPQKGEDKLSGVALRAGDRTAVGRGGFSLSGEFSKAPFPARSQVAQSETVASFLSNLPPTSV